MKKDDQYLRHLCRALPRSRAFAKFEIRKTVILFTSFFFLLSDISLACSPAIYQDPQYHLKLSKVENNKDVWTTVTEDEQSRSRHKNDDSVPIVRINNEEGEVVLLAKSKYSKEYKRFTSRGLSPIYKIKDQKHFYFDYEKDEWIENNLGEINLKKYGKSLIDLATLEPFILASFPDFTYRERDMILSPFRESRPQYFWLWYPSLNDERNIFLLLSSSSREEELKIVSSTVDKKTHEIEYKMKKTKMAEILQYPSNDYKQFIHFLNIKKEKGELTFFVKNGRIFDKYEVPEGYLLFSNLNCIEEGKCIKLENRGLSNGFLTKMKRTTGFEDHFHYSDDIFELKDDERHGGLSIPAIIEGKFVNHSYRLSWIKNKKFETTKSKWKSFSCPSW